MRACAYLGAVAGILAALGAAGAPAAAGESFATMQVRSVPHRQIEISIEMTVARTRLVIVPAWAGRISLLDFGDGNVLWNDPRVDGKVLPPGDAWAPWDGNATDAVLAIGGERQSQWRGLWLHPWKDIRLAPKGPVLAFAPGSAVGITFNRTYRPAPADGQVPDRVEIASETSPDVPLSARKTYGLSVDGRSLTYEYTLTCRGGEPRPWSVCERALAPGGGYALLPVAKGGAFPDGWAARDGTRVDPPGLAAPAGDFLAVRAGAAKPFGLAARLRAGWIANVRGASALLITYPVPGDGKYPACGGAHALVWVAGECLELEPLSAEVVLRPGESTTFRQVWHNLALPADVKRDDPQAVGRWLEKRAAELAKR